MALKLAVILGSGIELDDSLLSNINIISREDSGIHRKIIYICRFNGSELMVFRGRKHFYEGHTYSLLTENINKLAKFRIKNVIITNAAGGGNSNFLVGEVMLIKLHIYLNSRILCKSSNFPYSVKLQNLFEQSCRIAKVRIHKGVYGYYQGPAYETKAEIRFQKKFNIDAAGMSTVPEVTAACIKGINVMGVSVITNLLKENNVEPASHESVLNVAKTASKNLQKALSVL